MQPRFEWGFEMRRATATVGTIMACVMIIGASPASATTTLMTYGAPFDFNYAIGFLGPITSDCGSMTSLDSGAPNHETGRLHLGEGLRVRDCSVGEGLTYNWRIGEIHPSLRGRAGVISVLLRVRSVTRRHGGSGELSAGVGLRIGDASWDLASVSCADSTCIRAGRVRKGGTTVPLRARVDALPRTLDLVLDASAFGSGTGLIEASVDATIERIIVRPA